MPKRPRVTLGGLVYHVLNRANGRMRLFETDGDYMAFEGVLLESCAQTPVRILSYCVMPNHWHLVLWPREDGDLSKFMHWLTLTHTQRWHAWHQTTGTGHIYQGRFKSFPIEEDKHYLTVCRYVERNPVRAGLVRRAEDWRWGSLWSRTSGEPGQEPMLSDGPREWPADWLAMVNRPQSGDEEKRVRTSMGHGRPFGSPGWVQTTSQLLGLDFALARPRGRPRKSK